jgi:HSP20 family molecular chaperone IbpA
VGLFSRLFGLRKLDVHGDGEGLTIQTTTVKTEGDVPEWFEPPEITEDDDALVSRLKAPGLRPETIRLEPADDRLVVRAEGAEETFRFEIDTSGGFREAEATFAYDDPDLEVRIPKDS